MDWKEALYALLLYIAIYLFFLVQINQVLSQQ